MMKGKLIILTFLFKTIFSKNFLNNENEKRELSETELLQSSIYYPYLKSYHELKLTIGEYNKPLNLAVDLTSSLSWVHSYNCGNPSLNRNLETASNSTNSTNSSNSNSMLVSNTCKMLNKNIKIDTPYVDMNGSLFTEDLVFSKNFNAKNITLATVDYQQSLKFFENSNKFDGVLSLGYQFSKGKNYSFLSLLKDSKAVNNQVFSMGKGQIILGNYPNEVKQLPQYYHTCNVTTNEGVSQDLLDSWICDLTHFSVGESNDFKETQELDSRVIFDSMLTNILAPDSFIGLIKVHYLDLEENNDCYFVDDLKELYDNSFAKTNDTFVSKTGFTFLICKKPATKDLSLVIGGYGLIIPSSRLFTKHGDTKVIQKFETKGNVTTNYTETTNEDVYVFNIVFNLQKNNIWRVGKILMDQYIFVFDGEKSQVGMFGEHKRDFYQKWTEWWNSDGSTISNEDHVKYLIIASICLGSALLFVIICLVVQSLKNKASEEEAPLNDQEMSNKESN